MKLASERKTFFLLEKPSGVPLQDEATTGLEVDRSDSSSTTLASRAQAPNLHPEVPADQKIEALFVKFMSRLDKTGIAFFRVHLYFLCLVPRLSELVCHSQKVFRSTKYKVKNNYLVLLSVKFNVL